MEPLISPELSLDCRFSSPEAWVPKTIGDFIADVSKIRGASEKISKLDDYVNRLQDEMKKIDAFRRELPLCMLLLNDAIVVIKEELAKCKKSNEEPVLEEFIPLKKSEEEDEKVEDSKEKDINSRDKKNWMSSVQLWNSDDFSSSKSILKPDNKRKRTEEETKRPPMDNLFQSGRNRIVGRAFVPFKGSPNFPVMTVRKEDKDELPGVPGLSLCMPEIKNSREEINTFGFSRSGSSSAANGQPDLKAGQSQTGRKQRRCWSPELHRRFVSALEQLGGAQVATPKQIRELMQVDGLTNDEVKSHLQKYRIHTRKSPPSTNTPAAHGGLWMSQEQSHGQSSKQCNSQSGSPQGPLQLNGSSRATSMSDGEEDGVEDDEKTESHSWKGHIQLSGRDG